MGNVSMPKAEQLHAAERFWYAVRVAGEIALTACQSLSMWGGVSSADMPRFQSQRQLREIEFAILETRLNDPLECVKFEAEGLDY